MSFVNYTVKLDFDEIDEYVFPLDKPFNLEINYDNVKFCFIINLSSKSNNLICFGSGEHARDHKSSDGKIMSPPYYDKELCYEFFDESFIAYADPIFFQDKNITLGWFVGTKSQWYIEKIYEIIRIISTKQEISPRNTLFFGSFSSGYAAICLGTLMRGSSVIVNNSQFFILNYPERYVKNLFDILKKEFTSLTQSEIYELLKYRLNIIELFKKENYIPSITYCLNIGSNFDKNNQLIPFINELETLACFNNDFKIIVYNEKKEHLNNSLLDEKLIGIIKSSLQKKSINRNKRLSLGLKKETDKLWWEYFVKYFTARIDIKNIGNHSNNIKILDYSDKDAEITFPKWFEDDKGKGVVIQSFNGEIDLKIKCIQDGKILVKLKGINLVYKGKQRIPIFIEFKRLSINGNEILNNSKLVSHDDSYEYYGCDVKNGDILFLHVEWRPFKL